MDENELERFKDLLEELEKIIFPDPTIQQITKNLKLYINLGFQLDEKAIIEILKLFHSRLDKVEKKIVESICDIKQENKVKFLRDCYVKTFDSDAYFSNNEIENIQEFIRNLLPESHPEEFSRAYVIAILKETVSNFKKEFEKERSEELIKEMEHLLNEIRNSIFNTEYKNDFYKKLDEIFNANVIN
ncbi:9462_t:CDS:2 [Dentiscutata heterogama]|uniref:9462_t:CDS:1 n=1 Tax=Dentiscutata heterogama TaxID=1316150 RepID=A0ACA9N542_9GLOM|nr:9462_t:CDS:2 [Dentiscutata heterogama]